MKTWKEYRYAEARKVWFQNCSDLTLCNFFLQWICGKEEICQKELENLIRH